VNEACANAIEHPLDVHGADIELAAQIVDGTLSLVVNDSGRWKSETLSEDRGQGLKFTHSLMENVEIVRSRDGTSVRRVSRNRARYVGVRGQVPAARPGEPQDSRRRGQIRPGPRPAAGFVCERGDESCDEHRRLPVSRYDEPAPPRRA
jgi:hypothetical protein